MPFIVWRICVIVTVAVFWSQRSFLGCTFLYFVSCMWKDKGLELRVHPPDTVKFCWVPSRFSTYSFPTFWVDYEWHVWTAQKSKGVCVYESEYMKIHIFELGKKEWISEWSSQFYTQLKQLRKESLNKFRLERDSSYQANWELVIVWIRYIPVEEMRWKWIYENSYIWTAEERMIKWMIIAVLYAT